MHKIITYLVVLIFSVTLTAQNRTELKEHNSHQKEIKKVIEIFFDGLHKGDSSLVKSTLHNSIKIQTTFTNKAGEKILKTETKNQLLTAIAKKKS